MQFLLYIAKSVLSFYLSYILNFICFQMYFFSVEITFKADSFLNRCIWQMKSHLVEMQNKAILLIIIVELLVKQGQYVFCSPSFITSCKLYISCKLTQQLLLLLLLLYNHKIRSLPSTHHTTILKTLTLPSKFQREK